MAAVTVVLSSMFYYSSCGGFMTPRHLLTLTNYVKQQHTTRRAGWVTEPYGLFAAKITPQTFPEMLTSGGVI
jgi:hypothetical protein